MSVAVIFYVILNTPINKEENHICVMFLTITKTIYIVANLRNQLKFQLNPSVRSIEVEVVALSFVLMFAQ